MRHHTIGDGCLVGVESALSRWGSEYVSIRTHRDNDWALVASPYQARALARKLKKMADALDPPKPRVKAA